MTSDEIAVISKKWCFNAIKCERTLHETSKVDNVRPGGMTHCLRDKSVGKKKAIWFDEVMSDWVNLENLRRCNLAQPHRIDACYVKGDDIYLIEFKTDGDWEKLKNVLWAKFHDCYVQLLVRNIITVDLAQKHLYYMVVSSSRIRYSEDDLNKALSVGKKAEIMVKINNPMEDYLQRPWKHSELMPKANLRELTAFSCRAVYTMSVEQFERYVLESNWN